MVHTVKVFGIVNKVEIYVFLELSCFFNDPEDHHVGPNISIIGPVKNYLTWASLIAQLVKNPPAMHETPVRFLGQEDPLEKG